MFHKCWNSCFSNITRTVYILVLKSLFSYPTTKSQHHKPGSPVNVNGFLLRHTIRCVTYKGSVNGHTWSRFWLNFLDINCRTIYGTLYTLNFYCGLRSKSVIAHSLEFYSTVNIPHIQSIWIAIWILIAVLMKIDEDLMKIGRTKRTTRKHFCHMLTVWCDAVYG